VPFPAPYARSYLLERGSASHPLGGQGAWVGDRFTPLRFTALSKLLAQGNGVVDGDFLFVDGNHFVLAQIT